MLDLDLFLVGEQIIEALSMRYLGPDYSKVPYRFQREPPA